MTLTKLTKLAKNLFLAGLLMLASLTLITIFQTGKVHAASFTVATGNDENADNSSCSLSEAIENINDASTTNTDCSPAGGYGTDDTIAIPAGTVTLTADLPALTNSLTINGAGMGQTIVDGDSGQYRPFFSATGGSGITINIANLKVIGFLAAAVNAEGSDSLNIEKLDIDGTGSLNDSILVGIGSANNGGSTNTVNIRDTYIHDLSLDGASSPVVSGILISSSTDSTVNTDISKVTIANISNDIQSAGITFSAGVFTDYTPATFNTDINNVTITNIFSSDDSASGITQLGAVMGGTSNMLLSIYNSTITNVSGTNNPSSGLPSTGVGLIGGAPQEGDVVNLSLDLKNTIIVDATNYSGGSGQDSSCRVSDLSSVFGGTDGLVNTSLTSTGGNLTENSSCSSYFTQPTDQNNVSGLSDTLSALADNGGYVPTMALKNNSPAIDSGVTVPSLTTDARGSARPQGNAYDSGAYESPYTKASTSTTSSTDELAGTGQKQTLVSAISLLSLTIGLGLLARRRYMLQ